jgi:predicted nucleic acid-binding protein
MATLRVVLDTNVLLSDLAYPSSVPGKILAAWRHGSLDVLLSVYILEELRRVLPRLANRHGLSATKIDDLVDVYGSSRVNWLGSIKCKKPLSKLTR